MAKQPWGVLILHGFTSSLDCVNGIEPPLKDLGVVTRMPVLRGHGAVSPEALRGVTWHDWLADAEDALQALMAESQRAIVFGHSMGGLLALNLAASHGHQLDSLIVAAAAVQLANPAAPGRPFSFLAPLLTRVLSKWNMPPKYAQPDLAQYDTNYRWTPTDALGSFLELSGQTRTRLKEIAVPTLILQSRRDTTVAPESAEIIYHGISTPTEQKRIVWFGRTEHEMFRDCECDATIGAVVDYVRERTALA
jgi:carboxylesterase